jgi:hypothetical protein
MKVQIMKLLFMWLSPSSCYSLSLLESNILLNSFFSDILMYCRYKPIMRNISDEFWNIWKEAVMAYLIYCINLESG